jgi:hypothetical protein
MILTQAIRNAMVNDLAARKAADVATVPAGRLRPVTRTAAGPLFESRGKTPRRPTPSAGGRVLDGLEKKLMNSGNNGD